MSTTTLRLCAMALLLPLAACVNMSGLSGGSKYACAAPEGVACDSVSGTYANALHENLPSQRTSGTAAGDAAAPSRSAVPVAPAPARQPLAAPTAANALAGTGDAPALALRSQARVLRLWTKPWEDADGDLWDQGYVYQAVEKSPADAGVGQYDLKPSANNPDEDDERQPRLPGGDVQLHQP